MAWSRQRFFVAVAVVSGASLFLFAIAVAAAPRQTVTEDGSSAPASSAPVSPWPCGLIVTGELRAVAELAWEHSPTFREQCRKLALAGATMIVHPATSLELWRAETRIHRMEAGPTIAFARVRPSTHSLELIAHELEHVVEYLEGVKFLNEASRGGSGVSLSGGAYETQRAIDAGRRVAEQVRAGKIRAKKHQIIATK
jgi:hypothetical protein